MENDQKPVQKEEDDVEELLDTLWKNWESRRKCEKTHKPEYLKRE
jgi:hypothetical protein